MSSQAKSRYSSKGSKKKNGLLAKPKRPMSAYNFFFKAERAKILADTSDGNGTSFEDIGRIIGQRWKNIEGDELAKYKEMAKKDNERYRDQMKRFHKDELALMCRGYSTDNPLHSQDEGDTKTKNLEDSNMSGMWKLGMNSSKRNTSSSNTDSSYIVTAPALPAPAAADANQTQMSIASTLMTGNAVNENSQSQMTDIIQQQQQQLLNNNLANGESQTGIDQSQMQLLATGMLNPFQNTNLQGMTAGMSLNPMASTSSVEQNNSPPAAPNDDQIMQLLLQHLQSSSSYPNGKKVPNETVVALIVNQKASLQQRQQKLTEELNSLQTKINLLDGMLAIEMSQSQENAQITSGSQSNLPLPASSGLQDGSGMLTTEHFSQAFHQQKSSTDTVDASLGSLGSRTPVDGQMLGLSAIFGGTPAPAPSIQDLQYGNNQSSLSNFITAQSGMNNPGNNASGTSLQDSMSMFATQFMDNGN
mmetsp:Transcript_26063/g.55009  ORF Transcript_26063/g.55009 Transcript_26063/m.55009 type:complete len:474 (-) Transcript_26063:309-1730(-)|eukprot:CAMPEP_0183732746 /NCGR_PEP_ID=MMETSP0737-20130205/39244_1 /TAXON_ID=385413 /ORGANISM="Thalassiosira miniscula, Strain CCMP1093" /LENGTH=473 /DNA_ID=CAMNT_0025965841 /DNA_START=285 /DNA_END=1706 /DNA_ORIENTATION=-